MHMLFFTIYFGCSSQTNIEELSQTNKNTQVAENKKSSTASKKTPSKVKHIAVPQLYQAYKTPSEKRPVIIDVRSEKEYEKGHIPTAIHIPLQEIGDRSQEIEGYLKGKEQEIYLVCAVGGKSSIAAEQLASMGFNKAINVMGGTNGWVALGFPTEKGSPKKQNLK